MKSTVVGPYPRVGSEYGNRLRGELNRNPIDSALVRQLERDLTLEVVNEMVSSGIHLPNTGLVSVHDEITWPLEYVDGVDLSSGMKKVFHTNTHRKQAVVKGEVIRKAPIIDALFEIVSQQYPQVKVELSGPYTMAQHSVLGEKSPYKTLAEVALAYARVYREELARLKTVPLVQFNEPSAIAFGREHPNVAMLPELYAMMLEGLDVNVAVWTFYGKYSPDTLDLLLSLPVNVVGLDFVWDRDVDTLLKRKPVDKGIGIGLVDSGDSGNIRVENPNDLLRRLKGLEGYLDFDRALLSSNATLEHLPRDYARRKLALIGEITRRMNE